MDFSGSDLTDAIFDGADLHLAIFDKCRISNTHFEASKVLTQEQINMAGCSDEDVPPFLPEGLYPPQPQILPIKKLAGIRDKISQYKQEEFDFELRNMLREARGEGKQFYRVVSKHLHGRVVSKAKHHWMPMACVAMWKLWKEQGGHKDRIIYTTKTGQSSAVEIEFSTDVG